MADRIFAVLVVPLVTDGNGRLGFSLSRSASRPCASCCANPTSGRNSTSTSCSTQPVRWQGWRFLFLSAGHNQQDGLKARCDPSSEDCEAVSHAVQTELQIWTRLHVQLCSSQIETVFLSMRRNRFYCVCRDSSKPRDQLVLSWSCVTKKRAECMTMAIYLLICIVHHSSSV